MAAYAALNSVMYILQQIQHHPRPPIAIENQYMDSLSEIISFLQHFLENYSLLDDDELEALESRIADAAYAAEDVIESHIVDRILTVSSNNDGEKSSNNRFSKDLWKAKSNFQEQKNFKYHFRRGFKKMIQTLKCCHSHKTDHHIPSRDQERSCNSLFYQDLQKVIEYMNLITKEAINIQEKVKQIDDNQLPRNIISLSANIIGSSTVPSPKRKNTNTMVGFDDVLIQIMDRLTGYPTNRQVLPIIGMGGIGKTTIAKNVYDNQFIVHHFHIRVWVTISIEYRLRDILLEALSCVDQSYQKDKICESSEDELGGQLYRGLSGRTYLIVLDDVWSIETWEKLMLFFPDNNNGSRIMITTRLSDVSKHFRSHSLKLNFLDEDNSWDLFCKIVFPKDHCCPMVLEESGKKIARNCKGLPLSIVVIGGHLANSEKTQQHWEYVEKNLNSMINLEDDKRCLKILFLSYKHLPVHLKPCFLYMGVFPEDSVISVPRLINLWVDEGFLKPIKGKTLEMAAQEYLSQLIDRNLILAVKWGSSGKVKHCKIHDLLRDLCLREAEKNKFLWVTMVHDLDNLEEMQSQRRISIHEAVSKEEYHVDRVLEALPSKSLARSLICDFESACMLSHNLSLVRVFSMGYKYPYMLGTNSGYFSDLVNLRYLDFVTDQKSIFILPSSMHLQWNLQTLIIKAYNNVEVPAEIWKMSELRHLQIYYFSLPDPPNVPDNDVILRNLHTLKRVEDLKLSEEVIKRIPNLKVLQLSYNSPGEEGWWHNYCLNNLGLLNKLESLTILTYDFFERSSHIEFRQNFVLPHSLKKLTLFNNRFLWEDMKMIGSLPCLQVLKLEDSFRGDEWNPVEGEFLCLKFLLIHGCNDLVYWNANRTHFPCLQQLVIGDLDNLKEIPLDFGQIPTLKSIELRYCSDSVVVSAKNLLDEQVELGNEDLQIQVFCWKNIELESLATNNFKVRAFER